MTVLVMSAICITVVALSSTSVLDVVAGLPLIMFLPGAALISVVAPHRNSTSVLERFVWIVGASFGLTVLGGIVLNFVSGLTRTSWLMWVGAVVAICVASKPVVRRWQLVSIAKTGVVPVDNDGDESSHQDSAVGSDLPRTRLEPTKVPLRQIVLLFGATAIGVASLVLSIHTNDSTTRESFVQAWVLPHPTDDVASTSVLLGLRSHVGGERIFLVDVNVGNEPTKVFTVLLADGATWTRMITRRSGERVESTVYAPWQSSGQVVLAKVDLATPVT